VTGSTPVEARLEVPFLDLGPVHGGSREELLAALGEIVDAGAFVNGPQVAEFERVFAAYCGRRNCVGLASGLDALRLALLAAGLEPGDEVIVPANTFIATFEAVSQAGGIPVPVDALETDYNIDPAAVEAAVSARTRAVLPVHLYGQMADMRAVRRLASQQGLYVLEDACQAHGAQRDRLRAGAAGDAAAFSFYPSKNLGAWGDAGALVSDDDGIADRVRALREHGQTRKYRHELPGYTARLDTMQALVLLHKLPRLDAWNGERRAAAAFYDHELQGVGDLRLPPVPAGSEPVWHLYVVHTGEPAQMARHLAERGVATGRHYPECPHLSAAYAHLGCRRGAFPVAESLADGLLSLPIFPGISEAQLDAVTSSVREFFTRG
jgi:dTDP-3-amino-3,4,6-trideoxy-alpha-D-glucose transaminase